MSKKQILTDLGRLKEACKLGMLATSIPEASPPEKVRTASVSVDGVFSIKNYWKKKFSSSSVPLYLHAPKREIVGAGNCDNSVPVVGRYNKPLMPCSNARADELIKKGKAIRRFLKGIFYIKLLFRKTGTIQRVVCGIDPGSKEEAFTVMSSKKIFLNIQSDAANGNQIKQKIQLRNSMRRSRRWRKAPHRLHKQNKKRQKDRWLPPSTRARWEWKLRIAFVLVKLFPIEWFVVEDIRAKTLKTKNHKRQNYWNLNFSPLQIGKKFFYKKLLELANVMKVPGYITKFTRDLLGFKKDKNRGKERMNFYRHCVDSYCLAWLVAGEIGEKIINTKVKYIAPIIQERRSLHAINPIKGGKRSKYGGTNKCGFKKGSLVKHKIYGVMIVKGEKKGKLRLARTDSYFDVSKKDLRKTTNPDGWVVLAYNAWFIK